MATVTSAVGLGLGLADLDPGDPRRVELGMFAQLAGSLGAIGAACVWRSRAGLAGRTGVGRALSFYLLFLLAWVPLTLGVTSLWTALDWPRQPQPHLAYFAQWSDPLWLGIVVLLVCGVGPVVEEVVFRGHLQTGLTTLVGRDRAALISAVLFGLSHVGSGWVLLVPITVLGLFFSWLRVKSGGLRAPIVANPANGLAGQIILREDYPVSCDVDVCCSASC